MSFNVIHKWIATIGNNNGNNGGPTTADPGPADPCATVTCAILNEECDSADGVCKCGGGDTCEGKTNSPTCSSLTNPRRCTCGSEAACAAGETCDAQAGTCSWIVNLVMKEVRYIYLIFLKQNYIETYILL